MSTFNRLEVMAVWGFFRIFVRLLPQATCYKQMEHHLYIGLGSNLGDRRATLEEALQLVGRHVGRVVRVSAYCESEPWGFRSDNRFLNAAALVLTDLSPRECLRRTQHIERKLGRTRKSENGVYHDRTIDIDLLLYDDLCVQEPDLTLPHPRIRERDFVRLPLQEILEPQSPFPCS